MTDIRRRAPATARNREVILDVLRDELPAAGTVLEIAAGTGEHAVFFAAAFPGLAWQPTDPDPVALDSIAAWRRHAGLANLHEPRRLDVHDATWPIERADVIVCINMIHISPWSATEALFAGADRVLGEDGLVFTYGPYRIDGRHTAPSNEAFDLQLRAQDPDWGVRDRDEVAAVAQLRRFELASMTPMPANNFSLVFRRPG